MPFVGESYMDKTGRRTKPPLPIWSSKQVPVLSLLHEKKHCQRPPKKKTRSGVRMEKYQGTITFYCYYLETRVRERKNNPNAQCADSLPPHKKKTTKKSLTAAETEGTRSQGGREGKWGTHRPTDRCLRADFPMRPFHHTTTKIGREKNPSFSDPLSPPVARRRERGREKRLRRREALPSLPCVYSTVRPLKCFSPTPCTRGFETLVCLCSSKGGNFLHQINDDANLRQAGREGE